MTPNVYQWVRHVVEREKAEAPVVEFGSLDVNGSVRDLFATPYLGVDRVAGPGVDLVCDVTVDVPDANAATVVSTDMLEHCAEPQAAVESMHRCLREGGLLILAAPESWPLHHNDDWGDYWRFTRDGMQLLLKRAGFVEIQIEASEMEPGYRHTFAVARKR